LGISQATAIADYALARVLFEEYAAASQVDLCFRNFTTKLQSLSVRMRCTCRWALSRRRPITTIRLPTSVSGSGSRSERTAEREQGLRDTPESLYNQNATHFRQRLFIRSGCRLSRGPIRGRPDRREDARFSDSENFTEPAPQSARPGRDPHRRIFGTLRPRRTRSRRCCDLAARRGITSSRPPRRSCRARRGPSFRRAC
jgi:hypothetical protein